MSNQNNNEVTVMNEPNNCDNFVKPEVIENTLETKKEFNTNTDINLIHSEVEIKPEPFDEINLHEPECSIDIKIEKEELKLESESSCGDPLDESCLFKADNCGEWFPKQESQLKYHVQDGEYGRSKKIFTCLECGRTFPWKSLMDKHIMCHSGVKPYACDVCGNRFVTTNNLKTHMLIHTGDRPYVCDVCEKSFKRKLHLDKHRLIHSIEKPYECDLCNKKFGQKEYLSQHKQTHMNARPYACHLCTKAFTRKAHLVEHLQIHTDEKPYSCPMCDKKFKQRRTLDQHKATHKTLLVTL